MAPMQDFPGLREVVERRGELFASIDPDDRDKAKEIALSSLCALFDRNPGKVLTSSVNGARLLAEMCAQNFEELRADLWQRAEEIKKKDPRRTLIAYVSGDMLSAVMDVASQEIARVGIEATGEIFDALTFRRKDEAKARHVLPKIRERIRDELGAVLDFKTSELERPEFWRRSIGENIAKLWGSGVIRLPLANPSGATCGRVVLSFSECLRAPDPAEIRATLPDATRLRAVDDLRPNAKRLLLQFETESRTGEVVPHWAGIETSGDTLTVADPMRAETSAIVDAEPWRSLSGKKFNVGQ